MCQGIVLLFMMVIYNMFMIKNISYNSFSFMVILFLYKYVINMITLFSVII